MNKNELLKIIAKLLWGTCSGGARLSQASIFMDAFEESISGVLRNKGKVTIAGFGTFTVAQRKEKKGVNPKTGDKITIKAKNVPVFKPGKALKMMVK